MVTNNPKISHQHIDAAAKKEKRKTASAFISYSRKDAEIVEQLQKQLWFRGVRTWRDVTDLERGKPSEKDIRGRIDTTDLFVLFLTKDALDSDFIWKVEVPGALERFRKDYSFRIYPLFFGIKPNEFKQFCGNNHYLKLPSFAGDIFDPSNETEDFFVKRAARHGLEGALFHAIKTHSTGTTGYRPALAVRTFEDKSWEDRVDLDVDWSPLFGKPTESTLIIDYEIIPALKDIQATLNRLACAKTITIFINCRLTPALVIGWIFNAVSKTSITLVSGAQVWSTESPIGDVSIDCARKVTDPNKKEAIMILSLISPAWDIEKSVEEFAKREGIDWGQKVAFRLIGERIKNPADALAIASRVAEELKRLRGSHNIKRTHVFASVPAPLATLIGYKLNAAGLLDIYFSSQDKY